jgi:hypothetical protein
MYTKYQAGKGWSRPDQTADPDKLEQLEKVEQGDRPYAKL